MIRADGKKAKPAIGWREWVSLPDLGIEAVKAKVDTGARTSSLHAFEVETYLRFDGKEIVRFKVHPFQKDTAESVEAEAELVGARLVRSSSGREEIRPLIATTIELLGRRWPIELTLASRDSMGFRMLLARQAVRGEFLVDPGRSFLAGKPPSVRARRRRKANR
ncbi:MAG: ATP-dependent zinc protease [Planctomycetes bacterium]|nr:ATP-dependent zinc protease [Planctomycetota bacterium]